MSLFYFYIFGLMGVTAGCTGLCSKWGRQEFTGSQPLWVYKYAASLNGLFNLCMLVAVITIFIQYNLKWALLSVGEIVLGALFSGVILYVKREVIYLLAIFSPLMIIWLLGPLWKWWYLTETMMWTPVGFIIIFYLYASFMEK